MRMFSVFYNLLFFIPVLISIYAFYENLKNKTRLGIVLTHLSGFILLVSSALCIVVYGKSTKTLLIGYSLHYGFMSFLCAELFLFTIDFCHKKRIPLVARIIVWVIMITDAASFFLNIKYKHIFDCVYYFPGGNIFEVPAFKIHLALCYTFVAAALLVLLIYGIISVKFYRIQYFSLFISMSVLITINAFYIMIGVPRDYSEFSYSLILLAFTFIINKYIPRHLEHRMTWLLVDRVKYGVLFYNHHDHLIFENENAKRLACNFGNHYFRKEVWKNLKLEDPEDSEEHSKIISVLSDEGEIYYYSVKFRKLTENHFSRTETIVRYLLIEDITQEHIEKRKNEFLATHHFVTELYNQAHFCKKASELVKNNRQTKYAVVCITINKLRIYNEIFGRGMGDKILCTVANRLRGLKLDSKIVYGHYYSGHFVVCMPIADACIEKLNSLNFSNTVTADDIAVDLYYGMVQVNDVEEDMRVNCERAITAANTIKGSNVHFWAEYSFTMNNQFLHEQEIAAKFPKAIKNNDISIYIQPQISTVTGALVGGEVLVRWIEGDNVLSPAQFVPVLEKKGLIPALDYAVWEQAVKTLYYMHSIGLPISLSVNIAAQDFYRYNLFEVFTELVKKYDVKPEFLKLEITETEYLMDMETQINLIKMLQKEGFKIEMDDFGSGYSSLNTLKEMPVDVLKMDMKFFDGAGSKERSHIIIRNTIGMAHELGMPVIAEGVETEEQAEYLKKLGCDVIQGYFYSRPIPVEKFIEFRRQHNYDHLF